VQRGKDSLFLDRDNRDKWERKAGARVRAAAWVQQTSSGRRIQPQGIRRQARSARIWWHAGSLRTANAAGICGRACPQGHLEDWLNQHRNIPVQDQERMLSNDPRQAAAERRSAAF